MTMSSVNGDESKGGLTKGHATEYSATDSASQEKTPQMAQELGETWYAECNRAAPSGELLQTERGPEVDSRGQSECKLTKKAGGRELANGLGQLGAVS